MILFRRFRMNIIRDKIETDLRMNFEVHVWKECRLCKRIFARIWVWTYVCVLKVFCTSATYKEQRWLSREKIKGGYKLGTLYKGGLVSEIAGTKRTDCGELVCVWNCRSARAIVGSDKSLFCLVRQLFDSRSILLLLSVLWFGYSLIRYSQHAVFSR